MKRTSNYYKIVSSKILTNIQQISANFFFLVNKMEIHVRILRALTVLFGWMVWPLYYLYSFTKTRKLPAINRPDIIQQSATALAKKIRNKQLTSKAVVEAYIERIRDVNPILNAVVEDRFEAAIEESKKVDEFISETVKTAEQIETDTPLLGVPVTVKEACSLGGMSYCVGAKLRAGIRAEEDGLAVANLKKAGAIPLLVSNTPELCLSIETYNSITGYTKNPYNQHRTVGGSSGGEGALIASGASVLGIGSDFSGSIRLPSLFNGIFGHKPTPGIIPTKGHYPSIEDKEFQKLITIGPMTRYAEDLKLAVKIMAGPMTDVLNLDEEVTIKDLKVYYMTDFGFSLSQSWVDGEIKKAIIDGARFFNEVYGCPVQSLHLEELDDIFEICALQLGENGERIVNLKGERESSPYVELIKWLFCMSDYSFNVVYAKLAFRTLLFIPKRNAPKYNEIKNNLFQTIKDQLSDNGILIMPTFPQSAFNRYEQVLKLSSLGYPMVVNVLGLPATHVPVGLNENKLPIGFQVVAGPKQDRLTLAVAKELENVYGGWIPPPCSKAEP